MERRQRREGRAEWRGPWKPRKEGSNNGCVPVPGEEEAEEAEAAEAEEAEAEEAEAEEAEADDAEAAGFFRGRRRSSCWSSETP
jgi:ribonuclease E